MQLEKYETFIFDILSMNIEQIRTREQKKKTNNSSNINERSIFIDSKISITRAITLFTEIQMEENFQRMCNLFAEIYLKYFFVNTFS